MQDMRNTGLGAWASSHKTSGYFAPFFCYVEARPIMSGRKGVPTKDSLLVSMVTPGESR